MQMHNFGHGDNHNQIMTVNYSRGMSGADIIGNGSRKSFSSSSQRSGSSVGVRPYAYLSSQEYRSRDRVNDRYRRSNRIAADTLFSYEYNNLKQSTLQQHNIITRSRSSSQRGSNESTNDTQPLVDHSVGSWLRFRPYDEAEDRRSLFLNRASHAGKNQYVVKGSEDISMNPNANDFDPQSCNPIRHPDIVAYENRAQAADREGPRPIDFQYRHQGIREEHQPTERKHDDSSDLITAEARIEGNELRRHVLPTMIENADENGIQITFNNRERNDGDDVSFVEDDYNMDHKMPSQSQSFVAGMIKGKSSYDVANDHLVYRSNEGEVNRASVVLSLSDQDESLEKGKNSYRKNKKSNETVSSGIDKHRGSNDSKYESYECSVNHFQGDRSVEIPLFTFARPHMRAFHFAWMSFFIAFFTWFAISPLLSEIAISLKLDKEQVFASSIYSSGGTVVYRLIAGPLCDR